MTSILEQFEQAAVAATAKKAEAQRHIDLDRAFHHDLTSYHGPSIAFGIILAGGAYPLVIALIALVVVCGLTIWLVMTGGGRFGVMELAIMPFFILMHAGFGAVVGSIWTALVALVTLPILYLFVKSLKLKGSIIWLGAVAGGLVGFIAVLPLTLGLPLITPTLEPWHVVLILALGPGMSTVVGQLGGAWGGRRAARFAAVTDWKAVLADVAVQDSAGGGDSDSRADAADEPRFQFRIHHMLWIFVWLSLLFSVIRLSGIPFKFVLPLLVGWLAFQSASLYAGSRYFKWREDRLAAS